MTTDPPCTASASCEPGDHTYSWPCDLAPAGEDQATPEGSRQ